MKCNIIKHKLIFIFFFFLFLFFTCCLNCFGYESVSPSNPHYTFFMPDHLKDDLLTVSDKIPELLDDDYYYIFTASEYFKVADLVFVPKDSDIFLYGGIKNGDSIWSYLSSGSYIFYEFKLSSYDFAGHDIQINLDSLSPRKTKDRSSAILMTYKPSDNYFWCVTDIPFYTDTSKSTLWVKPYDFFNDIILPYIANEDEELANLSFDTLRISSGSFPRDDISFTLWNYDDGTIVFKLDLSQFSDYIERVDLDNPFSELGYAIPKNLLPKFSLKKGVTYDWSILYNTTASIDRFITADVSVSAGGGSSEGGSSDNDFSDLKDSFSDSADKIVESNKELQGSIDKQTEAIEEGNKTNKNIFERIGDILSFLNPFSENFFAYKLVELLMNGLKSLFIPEDNFFSNYFNELNDWFSERLGFLYYPFELLFDLLDRFMNINFSEPIINIPEIKEPFTNVALIKPINFNFNSLLENETLMIVHDIYFIIVDAVIYVGLVILLYKKYEEVINK